MAIKRPSPTSPPFDFAGIFRGSAIAVAIALAGSFTMGVIYHVTGLRDSTLPITASAILLIGVFCGGLTAARRSGAKGLFHGLGVGLIVFFLIWIVMAFLPAGVSFFPLAQKLFICLAGGALGGIAGILL